MKAIVLDGSQANDITARRVSRALAAALQAKGWSGDYIVLRDQKIGACAGDFFCWVRSPGVCNVDDDNRSIAKAMMGSDVVVFLTPITFGGYSSTLKRAVDHMIQNISPYFAKIGGETHHRRRYSRYPHLLVIGWMDSPDARTGTIFKHLVKRNAINFYAEKAACGVVIADQSDEDVAAIVRAAVDDLGEGQQLKTEGLPAGGSIVHSASEPPRRALLLVGSPRTHKSTSVSLGGYMFEQLGSRSIQTETVFVHTVVRSQEKMNAFLESIGAADLVTLAFPLYVDSLPAPVIAALEQIAAYRLMRRQSGGPLFTAISNCGFPEAQHNATAVAICETFANKANLRWGGSLALSGGMIGGLPLVDAGGRTLRIRKALDIAAEALAKGRNIPKPAQDLISKPVIPHWMYRLTGNFGWPRTARQYGVEKSLKRQPYFAKS